MSDSRTCSGFQLDRFTRDELNGLQYLGFKIQEVKDQKTGRWFKSSRCKIQLSNNQSECTECEKAKKSIFAVIEITRSGHDGEDEEEDEEGMTPSASKARKVALTSASSSSRQRRQSAIDAADKGIAVAFANLPSVHPKALSKVNKSDLLNFGIKLGDEQDKTEWEEFQMPHEFSYYYHLVLRTTELLSNQATTRLFLNPMLHVVVDQFEGRLQLAVDYHINLFNIAGTVDYAIVATDPNLDKYLPFCVAFEVKPPSDSTLTYNLEAQAAATLIYLEKVWSKQKHAKVWAILTDSERWDIYCVMAGKCTMMHQFLNNRNSDTYFQRIYNILYYIVRDCDSMYHSTS